VGTNNRYFDEMAARLTIAAKSMVHVLIWASGSIFTRAPDKKRIGPAPSIS
jgi:hypothetical protein